MSASWIADAVAGLPALCTTDEACSVLRCSRRHLYRLLSCGKLRAVKAGAGASRVLVPRAAVADYLRGLSEAA